jgi:hypothetical protein
VVAIDFEIAASLHYENEKSNKETTSTETETSVYFLLGDGDADDVFVVDVFTDPTYGTFLFKTVSGRSICCHEANTAQTAHPFMSVWSRPEVPVLPDDQMVFQLKLGNVGVVPYRFQLFTYHHDNSFISLVLIAYYYDYDYYHHFHNPCCWAS